MNLDSPWKIGTLVALLVLARVAWGLWKKAPSRKTVLEFLDAGLIAFTLVFLIIRPFVVQAFFIPSGSMFPTLHEHDRILVNRFVYRFTAPKRGDIIVFDAPPYALQSGVAQADFVKRLIGLPGDRVQVKAYEGVFINGEKLEEAPGTITPGYDWPTDGKPYVVREGNYLVLGDNRNTSYDSHLWQLRTTGEFHPELPSGRLLGKAMVIFWPPLRIGLLSDNAQAHLPSDVKQTGAAHAAR